MRREKLAVWSPLVKAVWPREAASTCLAASVRVGDPVVYDLFTKAYGRILGPGLAALDSRLPDSIAARSPLAAAWKDLTRELRRFMDLGLAAA